MYNLKLISNLTSICYLIIQKKKKALDNLVELLLECTHKGTNMKCVKYLLCD